MQFNDTVLSNVEVVCQVLHCELQIKLNYTQEVVVDRQTRCFFTVSTFAFQLQEPFLSHSHYYCVATGYGISEVLDLSMLLGKFTMK